MKKKFEGVRGRGLKIASGLSMLLVVLYLFSNSYSVLKRWIFGSSDKSLPVCSDKVNIHLIKGGEVGYLKSNENCLSGIVRLPLNTRFISDAPGWVEYWFITPNGYKKYSVNDGDVNFPKTVLPSCAFRIRGKSGTVRIQLEK